MGSKLSTGGSNPQNYLLGRGRLYLSRVNEAGFPVGGFRDVGNVPDFVLNVESEDLEHTSSRSGVRTVDKKVLVSQTAGMSVTLDELNLNNIAMFTSGEEDTWAQGVLSIAGNDNLEVVDLDRWYNLYDVADMATAGYPQGNRAFKITSGTVVVTDPSGSPVYVEGTDYEVDYVMGRIKVLSTGSIPAGTLVAPEKLDVDFDAVAVTMERVKALTKSSLHFALQFISENPADDGHQMILTGHSVTLIPDGDMSLIGDEFAQMAFTGTFEKREAVDAAAPVFRLDTYTDAKVA